MSEPAPVYNGRFPASAKQRRPAPLPAKAHKLALRVLQLAKEPGEYEFTLIVDENGHWQLRPPAKVEELG
jgi:hypothetical protein